jgi:hypothetical protein
LIDDPGWLGIDKRSISMNKDNHVVEAHTAAAQEHETTAKSHRAAADYCNKGHHEACQQHAKEALDHSTKAHASSQLAHEKSAQPAVALAGK